MTCSICRFTTHLSENIPRLYKKVTQMNRTVLVEDFIWETKSPAEYRALLAPFGCLITIHILFAQKHHFNTDVWVEYSDCAPVSDEQVREYANQLRAEYGQPCSDHPEWKSTRLEVMDRIGKSFKHFRVGLGKQPGWLLWVCFEFMRR